MSVTAADATSCALHDAGTCRPAPTCPLPIPDQLRQRPVSPPSWPAISRPTCGSMRQRRAPHRLPSATAGEDGGGQPAAHPTLGILDGAGGVDRAPAHCTCPPREAPAGAGRPHHRPGPAPLRRALRAAANSSTSWHRPPDDDFHGALRPAPRRHLERLRAAKSRTCTGAWPQPAAVRHQHPERPPGRHRGGLRRSS